MILGRLIVPTRGKMRFLGDGLLPRVEKCDSWVMDYSRAWECAIPGLWTAPARGNSQFLSGGLLPRVELRDSWAVDCSRAWNCAIPGLWTTPARGKIRFLGDGLFQYSDRHNFELSVISTFILKN